MPTFDLAKWTAGVKPDQYNYQTRDPNASRTLAELQDIANAAEKAGETLIRADFTSYDWSCIVQFVLTIRNLPEIPDYAIAALKATDDLPTTPETMQDVVPAYAWAYRNDDK